MIALNPARRLAAAAALVVLAAAASPAWAIDIVRVESPGGIKAWLVEDHQNPIITLQAAFRGGSTRDPEGKEGLAQFVSGLLDEGAGELDSQAFQRRLEDNSISLRFSASLESFGARLRTLKRDKDEAFGLLKLAMTQPRFGDEPVARIRNQILVGLRQAAENPDHIANDTLSATFFPSHPYGRPNEGTAETVNSITRDDLMGFVKRQLAKDNLYIGVVGDVTPAELGLLLDDAFGGLPDTAKLAPVADVKPVAAGETIVVRKPVSQSSILFGHEGLLRDDPDFYAAYVLNYVLGGGAFNSRLWTEVREKRGLAYSVGTFLHPLDHASMMLGSVGTDNTRVAETLKVVRDEWARIAEDGVTADELDHAKRYLTGSYALRFTSSSGIARILVGLQLEGFGPEYIDNRNGFIEAVTLADAKRVAARLFEPERLTFVVVGQPEGLTEAKGIETR